MNRFIVIRSTRDAIGVALAIILACFLIIAATAALAADFARADASQSCAEDSPCWTWSRMGNRKREVVTLSGNVRVVGPCRFARMWASGHIGYSIVVDGHRYGGMLEPMRGDAWARAHGCEVSA